MRLEHRNRDAWNRQMYEAMDTLEASGYSAEIFHRCAREIRKAVEQRAIIAVYVFTSKAEVIRDTRATRPGSPERQRLRAWLRKNITAVGCRGFYVARIVSAEHHARAA